jgi:hypothetical protein
MRWLLCWFAERTRLDKIRLVILSFGLLIDENIRACKTPEDYSALPPFNIKGPS